MKYLWDIFEAFINFADGVILLIFVIKYFGFKDIIRKRFLIIALFSIILFVVVSVINSYDKYEGFIALIYGFIIFLFTLLFLEGSILEKIFISIFEQSLLSGITLIIPLLLSLIFKQEISEMMIMKFDIPRFLSMIMIIIVYVAILWLIIYNKKEFKEMKKFQWIILILFPFISSILIISIMEIILAVKNSTLYYIYIIISISSIVLLNIAVYVFMSILNRNNKIIMDYKLENQRRHDEEKNIEDITNMYEKIRVIKHDAKQHNESVISKIIALPEINDSQREYVSNIISYLNDINKDISLIKSTVYTENKAIDGLLNYKISTAIEKNISPEIVIDKNISGVLDTDLCSVIGNLLDNAIESCSKNDCNNKRIIFNMSMQNSYLYICVKNSISKSIIESNPNLTTTKNNKEHGMGLKSVRAIAKKYSGVFKTDEKENFFIAEILLLKQI